MLLHLSLPRRRHTALFHFNSIQWGNHSWRRKGSNPWFTQIIDNAWIWIEGDHYHNNGTIVSSSSWIVWRRRLSSRSTPFSLVCISAYPSFILCAKYNSCQTCCYCCRCNDGCRARPSVHYVCWTWRWAASSPPSFLFFSSFSSLLQIHQLKRPGVCMPQCVWVHHHHHHHHYGVKNSVL